MEYERGTTVQLVKESDDVPVGEKGTYLASRTRDGKYMVEFFQYGMHWVAPTDLERSEDSEG